MDIQQKQQKQPKKKIKLAKLSELNLPKLGKGIMPDIVKFRKRTKRLMMNDFFELATSAYKTRYFEEQMSDPDWRNSFDRPISQIYKLNLRNLDYLHCLHGPKIDEYELMRKHAQVQKYNNTPKYSYTTSKDGNNQVTNCNINCSIDELGDLFNTDNPFDIFSKLPLFNQNNTFAQFDQFPKFNAKDGVVKNVITKKDKNGNVTTITNTTRTNNYSINLLPFIPIRMPVEPGEKKKFFAYKLGGAVPGEINIYYYYLKDYKILICDKSKFLPRNAIMSQEEKETLYNTIIDSASLGIDQLILNDPYIYTDEDDELLEELQNAEICQYA
jgi:hypothetical protein